MSARLTISGPRLDVDKVLSTLSLKAYQIWHRGEPMTLRQNTARRHVDSGCSLLASNAAFDDVQGQLRQTERFLRKHLASLKTFCRARGVKHRVLDFGINWKTTFTHTDRLPAELVSLAGALGLEIHISHYPVSRE